MRKIWSSLRMPSSFWLSALRRGEIGAERLFDDDAPPSAVFFARQAGFAEMAADRRKGGRRRRQIEQAVALGPALALDAFKLAADFLVGLVVVGIALAHRRRSRAGA